MSGVCPFSSGLLTLNDRQFCFGRQMAVQTCRKLVRTLSGSVTEAIALTSSDLGIFVPDQSRNATIRQRVIELYDHLSPSLHAYLCCLGMSPDHGEDVIQETFLPWSRNLSHP